MKEYKLSIKYGPGVPGSTEIKIDDKIFPYVHRYTLEQSVYNEIPLLNLDITADALVFEGRAEINLNKLDVIDDEIGRQIYKKLKERYEINERFKQPFIPEDAVAKVRPVDLEGREGT